jgi:uncharacterized protein HemY
VVSEFVRPCLRGVGLLIPVLPAALAATEPSPGAIKAWTALANSRPDEVRRLVGRDDSRSARLAAAVARMTTQPATDDHMREAEEVFVALEQGDDEVSAQAAYLRARLYQLHYSQPDYAKAAELFRALAQRRPRSHWAQLGLVKLGVMKLYLPDASSVGGDRLGFAESLLADITEPRMQRDLHLQIGRAGIVLKQPLPRLLPHLVAAEKIGGISSSAREDLLVQIGVLSYRAKLWSQAKEYFEYYLAEYPKNVRAYGIREMLGKTTAELAKAPSS